MSKLIINITPEDTIKEKLLGKVKIQANYTKEITAEIDDEEKIEAAGQRTIQLSSKLDGRIEINNYSDLTTVDLSIINSNSSTIIKVSDLLPTKDNRRSIFTLEWKVGVGDVKLIKESLTANPPEILKTLNRRGRFITIGFNAPQFRDYSLLISPVKIEDLNEELLSSIFEVQDFRTTSRRLTKDLLPGLARLPISTVSTVNVEISGRFMFTLPLAENEVDEEDGWIWILSGSETFVGIYKEKSLKPIPNEVTILLPAPVHSGTDTESSLNGATNNIGVTSDINVNGVPIDVSEDELLTEPSLFSDDPGSYCKPFSNSNRIVGERAFQTILRVEQPEIGGEPSVPPDTGQPPYNPVIPPLEVGRVAVMMARSPSTGTSQPVPSRFTGMFNGLSTMGTKAKIAQRRKWTLTKSRGRYVLDGDDALDWEGDSFPYQATTLAFGHILDTRVRWRSNGYSHGNVAHTLTLAPRQTKRIVTVQSQIKDKTRREEFTQATDTVDQKTQREYSYLNAVESELNEWASGGSSSSTTGVAGGIGFVLGPVVFGGGAAHGTAKSDSWQRGGRDVAAKEEQSLRDSIRQHGESLRKLESLVVLEQSQEEFVQGVSEVVRNPNYGHSLTVIYHEILRHLRIDTEVVGAKECIFVPFALEPFTFERALRWRDILEVHLQKRRLRWVMRYLQDLDDSGDYIGTSIPKGRRSEHPIRYLSGSLYIKLAIERPRDDDTGAFNDFTWSPLIPFLTFSPMSIWTRLKQLSEKKRDDYFQREYAPTIATQWVNTLMLTGMEGADFTLATSYGFNKTIRVDFSYTTGNGLLSREEMQNIVVKAKDSLPAKSVANLIKSSLHYYTDNYDNQVSSHQNINDFINIEDGTPTNDGASSNIPLTDWERKDMQVEISHAAKELEAHLNEHSEYYHKTIWWAMDRDKLFMMLDGIYLSNEDTRSVASVVKREPIAIVGNSLVYPVAGGAHIGVDGINTPTELNNYYRDSSVKSEPMRVSLPTSGLYAQAIMDDCDALEEHFGSTDWVLSDNEPELAEIGSDLLNSRRASLPNVQPTEFGPSIINLQNAANPPAPSGLSDVLNAAQNSGAFRDMAGLAGTQANARAAMESAASLASEFGSKALDLEKTKIAAKVANEKLSVIKKAAKEKLSSADKTKEAGDKVIDELVNKADDTTSSEVVEELAKTSDNHDVNIEADQKAKKISIKSNRTSRRKKKGRESDFNLIIAPGNFANFAFDRGVLEYSLVKDGESRESVLDYNPRAQLIEKIKLIDNSEMGDFKIYFEPLESGGTPTSTSNPYFRGSAPFAVKEDSNTIYMKVSIKFDTETISAVDKTEALNKTIEKYTSLRKLSAGLGLFKVLEIGAEIGDDTSSSTEDGTVVSDTTTRLWKVKYPLRNLSVKQISR